MKLIGELLKFKKSGDDWLCIHKVSGYEVGVVVCYPLWVEWVFKPHPTNVYSVDMLADIKSFMEQLK